MKIKYVVPSYGRAKSMRTLDYITKAVCVVAEREVEDYKKYHPSYDESRFVVCPDEVQGHGKPKVMNWILDNVFVDCDAVVVMDDDIYSYMAHIKDGTNRPLDEGEVYQIFENNCRLAQEWGCGMFAFGKGGQDRMMHNCTAPFKLHNTGSGQLMGFVRNDGIRFDEKLLTSEDMDIQLQEIQKYHKMLTVDRYYLDVKQWTNDGGYQAIRDGRDTDKKYRDVLRAKWGNAVRVTKKQKVGVAYTISVPLKGV